MFLQKKKCIFGYISKSVWVKSKKKALTYRGISHRCPTGSTKRTYGGDSLFNFYSH